MKKKDSLIYNILSSLFVWVCLNFHFFNSVGTHELWKTGIERATEDERRELITV